MSSPPGPTVENRRLPRTERRFSAVSISVDPPAVAPPSADARAAALLRRAREHGVTTFDVADARFPERAERLIATAFPIPDPDLAVIVGRSVESLASERTRQGDSSPPQDLDTALAESLERSRRRLAPVALSVIEWHPGPGGGAEDAPGSAALPGTTTGPGELVWSVRLPTPVSVLPKFERSPALFTSELSLLDLGLVSVFEPTDDQVEARVVARNPFADGRLDGSRFATTAMLAGPGAGPVDLRRLRAEFDPVLALGFLTKDRRRTLAQAALHFVLRWPWVATAVIPLPSPERFEEILGFGGTPPLSDDELARLSLVK